jgi:hypothetical protein
MAKRKAKRGAKPTKTRRKSAARPVKRKASAKKSAPARKASKKTPPKAAAKKNTASRAKPKATARKKSSTAAAGKVPRLDRARRTLADAEPHSTPSSLDMDRRGSAARSGRAGMAQSQRDHQGMSPDLQAGDSDVDIEDAYFTGEEAPGGDNPTPDQDIVDDIGKALGVTYDDNEELKASDKVIERDKHRWELDPASAEDFRDRDKK